MNALGEYGRTAIVFLAPLTAGPASPTSCSGAGLASLILQKDEL